MSQGTHLSEPAADLGSVTIGDITLTYRKRDGGGTHYLGRSHVEEYHSPLYPLLRRALAPSACIDIGANYGYTGLLMRRAFPDCDLTLVEPIPWLEPFIRHNFEANGAHFDRLLSGIVSDSTSGPRSAFGVNTNSSQDSRVVPIRDHWEVVETDVHTITSLAADISEDSGVYIKIDTQGWEEKVFAGGEAFLAQHNKWFIKTEFAPQWMESQGTDPVDFLRHINELYDLHESVGRVRWNCPTLADAIGPKLNHGDEAAFVSYVRNLARNDLGWVDLYVLPPEGRRGYSVNGQD